MLLVGARRLEHLCQKTTEPSDDRELAEAIHGRAAQGPIGVERCIGPRANRAIGSEPSDGRYGRHRGSGVWAFRGFNPHRKKNKSYYPLFAHLAQTGQILKSRNRPGNVHDSKGADAFLRELIGELRGQFGRSRKLEFRTDAAFFNEKILKRLERSRSEFAIKAPFWFGLKEVVAGRKRWHRVRRLLHQTLHRALEYHRPDRDLSEASSTSNGEELPARPGRRYFEYSAVATNKSFGWARRPRENLELRSQFALDVVKSYGQ